MMKGLLLLIIVFISLSLYSQKKMGYSLVKDYPDLLVNPYSSLSDTAIIKTTKDVIHPHLMESLSVQERDSFRRMIRGRKKKKPLNLTESIYCFKPYFDRLRYEDPHFRLHIPWFIKKHEKANTEEVAILPWEVLNVNDTLIIGCSYDESFRKGDRILKVNDIPVEEFIKYAYTERYSPFFVYQAYCHYAYSPAYTVEIQRQGQVMEVKTQGMTYKQYLKNDASANQEEIFAACKTGYFSIANFQSNNSLIKKLTSFIKRLKKADYSNLIIDIRKNGGGSGRDFDELLSLFIEKDTVAYLKNVKVRVSEITLKDYDFLTREKMGELVSLPDPYFVKFIPLKREKYQGMNVYVLISENTGSQAATFANILQYNNSAKLAGVPLLHNALKYGEVAYLNWISNAFAAISMSTVEYDEYTRSPDDQVYPDIFIPYVASEYMKGGDPVLEKLLRYIQEQNSK